MKPEVVKKLHRKQIFDYSWTKSTPDHRLSDWSLLSSEALPEQLASVESVNKRILLSHISFTIAKCSHLLEYFL